MMKKRNNMQFLAAAALTAVLVTSQISFAAVMDDGVEVVQTNCLIPDNITIEQPIPLSDIELPKSDYGTFSWVDDSFIPSMRVQSCDVIFRPYDTTELSKFKEWDGQSDVVYSSIKVVVSSINSDELENSAPPEEPSDMEGEQEIAESEVTDTPQITEMPEVTDAPVQESETDKGEVSADITDDGEVVVFEEDTVDESEEDAENTESSDILDAVVTPEEDNNSIFDKAEEVVEEDERVQNAATDFSDEEKAELAKENHTCNGISVSGINLPWYVQFRVASGEHYEFTNEADANVFKAYEFVLWDLMNDTEYEIPDGEYLSVTVPVKAGYDYTIEHILDSGAMETIIPSVDGSTMVFSTHSFSPFGIAGSKALVGEEIEDGSYSSEDNSDVGSTTSAPSDADGNTESTDASASAEKDSAQPTISGEQSTQSDSSDQNDAAVDSSSPQAVNTGDDTPILPFVLLGAAAVVIIGILVYLKKKNK